MLFKNSSILVGTEDNKYDCLGLGININYEISNWSWKWLGHVFRMQNRRHPYATLERNPSG